jgi:hypothetical protein
LLLANSLKNSEKEFRVLHTISLFMIKRELYKETKFGFSTKNFSETNDGFVLA